jgi:hypothetical protein
MKKLVVVAFLLVAVTLMATAFPTNSDAFFGGRGSGCGCYSGYASPAYGWGSYSWPASYGWYGGYGYGGYGYGRGYGRGMRGGMGFGFGY